MLLVLEVGNTNTSVGVYDGSRLLVSWRLTSRRDQTADEYGVFIQTLLASRGLRTQDIGGVAISNVVPPVQQTLERVSETYFGIEPFTVRPGVNAPLPLNVDNTTEVGADRVCNGVAAVNFDCVNAHGEFVGGAIAPGMVTAAEAPISRAARLFRVELLAPATAIGRNTATNIQSGVVFGYAGLVDGLVERIRAELGADAKVIATGGLAVQLHRVARSLQIVNPNLRLEGLRMMWERARSARG
jgi:type III pantothenate kinase